ncbi:hypothetical protein Q8G35_25510 [Peribacillus simplex]|uniref:Uncharacterized protein n=2 Tax=Peribacillus TaxID=2675229 RepID=A0AA90SYL8_9BACI|nr:MULTISPECIES: hypothetical protein [Peribacillus]MDP1421628.1 hypothetical protein [Peribacillus simplex]MDP1454335.1 hypothetical protein [Peribacillus frigoritolerans]
MKKQKGSGKCTFHRMMFPIQLAQSNTFNSIGMVLSKLYTELIGAEGTRIRRRKPRRLPDRPRKASAWSGNQRPNCTSHKNRQTRFSSSLSTV